MVYSLLGKSNLLVVFFSVLFMYDVNFYHFHLTIHSIKLFCWTGNVAATKRINYLFGVEIQVVFMVKACSLEHFGI